MAKPIEEPTPDTIDSLEALVRWLNRRSSADAQAVALRIALRVFPLVLKTANPKKGETQPDWLPPLVLQSFRAVFLANVSFGEIVKTVETVKLELSAHVTEAANAVIVGSAISIENIAASGAASSAARAAASINQAAAAAAALNAADYASNISEAGVRDYLWRAIQSDALWLEKQSGKLDGGANLTRQPLWLNDRRLGVPTASNIPVWAREIVEEFERRAGAETSRLGLIAEWYRALLPDDPYTKPHSVFGEKADLKIATKDNEFWERDPDVVMTDISQIVGGEQVVTTTPTPLPPRIIEDTKVVPDRATRLDLLGRKPFAEALAQRINNVRIAQLGALAKEREALAETGRADDVRGDGFAVHLHAPWGAGKTSILKMMEDYMTSPERPSDARWVIVNFNAWRHERRNPPWWPLMEALHRAGQAHLDKCCVDKKKRKTYNRTLASLQKTVARFYFTNGNQKTANRLWRRWHFSNIWAVAGPYLIAAAIFILLLGVLLLIPSFGGSGGVKTLFSVLTSGAAAFGALALVGRWFVHGAAKNAERHAELSKDPLKRVTKLFRTIVEDVEAPIGIFIDDLDRCNADFVVDLLEGVQTAFRHENVVYVVAADKNWIKAAFETRYESFAPKVSKPGQPLGYLFLEKIFQMSVPVPGISDELKKDHVNRLATGASGDDPRPADEIVEAAEPVLSEADFQEAVKKEVEDLGKKYTAGATREDINKELGEKSTSVRKAAAAEVLNTSREAEKQQKHLLRQYAAYLPDIPRLMVRMINAFTMRNIVGVLENDFETSAETIARWTVLEQRYPAVADILIDNPEWATKIGKDEKPEAIKIYANIEAIQKIIGGGATDALTEENIRRITRGSRS